MRLLVKAVLVMGTGYLLIVGWDRWQTYRSMLPLPGATSVDIYRLSLMPYGSDSPPKGHLPYPLPHWRTFDSSAIIKSHITLGRGDADKVNALLNSYNSYRDNRWHKLRFDAAYAIVMKSGEKRVEILVDRSSSESFISRYSPGKVERSGIEFGYEWYRYLQGVFPDLAEKSR